MERRVASSKNAYDTIECMVIERRRSKGKVAVITLAALLVLAAVGFGGYYYLKHYPEGVGPTPPPTQTTLEGRAVCLPHKPGGDVHTMECAVGFQTKEGTVYGVSSNYDEHATLASATGSDTLFRVTGNLEPTEDQKYDITSLIVVKNVEALD
jgi:hypothetical protein